MIIRNFLSMSLGVGGNRVGNGTADPVITTTSIPTATDTGAYSQQFAKTGMAGGLWSHVVAGGSLPAGLTFSTGGLLSGTVDDRSNEVPFTVKYTDPQGRSDTQVITLTISDPTNITTESLDSGTEDVAYEQQVNHEGGTSPVVFDISAGVLPAGLTISSEGLISGTPTIAANYAFTVRATDANLVVDTADLSIDIEAGAPPGAPTGWMNLEGVSDGAFPTTANQGSVVGDWVRNGTHVTVASDGPNGISYAKNVADADYVKLNGKTMADLIAAGAGTIALLFRITTTGADGTNYYNNHSVIRSSDSLIGISGYATGNTITCFMRGGSENNYLQLPASGTYSTGTWRALVMRWTGGATDKIFARLNGEVAWAEEITTQDIFALTGTPRIGDGANASTSGEAHVLFYNTDVGATVGDEIMDWLCAKSGLSD